MQKLTKVNKNDIQLSKDALNIRQQLFCRYYTLIGSDTFQNNRLSAEKAGYSKKTAGVQGCQMLTRPKIKAYIQTLWTAALDDAGLTPEFVLQAMRHNMQKLSEAGDHKGAEICAQDIAKTMGMFVDRHVIEQPEEHKPKTPLALAAAEAASATYNKVLASSEVTRDIIEARNELRPPERREV